MTDSVKQAGLDYFGRGHWLNPIQERLSLRARRRMFDFWLEFRGVAAGSRLLDVGATPDCERLDSNCMIPWFLNAQMQVSLYSPEPLEGLKNVFPSVDILPPHEAPEEAIRSVRIPAGTGTFDWVSSSAVLEHVGNRSKQLEFIRECGRVGGAIFLTTPNRFHWLEFHTKLPLIHWLPKSLHRWVLSLIGKPFWAQEINLNLVSGGELRTLAREALGPGFQVKVNRVWSLGMPSNLVLLARRRGESGMGPT